MMYFEIGIRYNKMLDNGIRKMVTEQFIVDALSFTEAEARIVEEMQPYISGEFSVSTMKRANFSEVVADELGDVSQYGNDKWYKAKLNFIIVDAKSGREKKRPFYLLVNAGSVNAAHDLIVVHMKGVLSDYEIANIDETNILDVFFYEAKTDEKTPESNIANNQ